MTEVHLCLDKVKAISFEAFKITTTLQKKSCISKFAKYCDAKHYGVKK